MKKIILGTTALVAATALTAGSASAAEKIKLNVGGYLQTSFVIADYETGTNLPTNMRNEGEIIFSGKTTLDNGLEFGVNIQLEARQSTDQIDESFMYVEGSFGRINAGSENSAAYLMHYDAPSPTPAWGLNSPNATASGTNFMSARPNELGDTDKLTYFTPRFGGFQFGASYTPDASWETGSTGSPYGVVGLEGGVEEGYSVAVNYVQKFNAVSVAASVGYEFIVDNTAGIDDREIVAVGTSIGFAGFTVGGGYKFSDNDGGVANLERHEYNVGVKYGQGPWSVGVQYAGVDDRGTAALEGDVDAIVVGGQYSLGAGITAFGGVQFFETDGTRIPAAVGDNATVFFMGTAISF